MEKHLLISDPKLAVTKGISFFNFALSCINTEIRQKQDFTHTDNVPVILMNRYQPEQPDGVIVV